MNVRRYNLVMAVYPNARGFAYVIFGRPDFPIDWGVSELPAQQRLGLALRRMSRLLDQYDLDVVLLRRVPKTSRATRLVSLVQAMDELARRREIRTSAISRQQVRQAFTNVEPPTRYLIAQAIAERIPSFRPLLPPRRKIWIGEGGRMGLFDAAALALTFLASNKVTVSPQSASTTSAITTDPTIAATSTP
jgi:hypothetical protein